MDDIRPIPGYPGYAASRDGRIKGKHQRWLKPCLNKDGHQQVNIYCDGHRYTLTVHYLVLITWVGRYPGMGMEARHIDGHGTNNHADNLEWVAHGTSARGVTHNRGEANPSAKLTENDVREIRSLIKTGNLTKVEIGRRYGVTGEMIRVIQVGKRWGWLT